MKIKLNFLLISLTGILHGRSRENEPRFQWQNVRKDSAELVPHPSRKETRLSALSRLQRS
jgi:hypothetical protein